MLTHENVVADAAAVVKSFEVMTLGLAIAGFCFSSCESRLFLLMSCILFQASVVPSTKDVSISFLPLAHMFERVVQVGCNLQNTFTFTTHPVGCFMVRQRYLTSAIQ